MAPETQTSRLEETGGAGASPDVQQILSGPGGFEGFAKDQLIVILKGSEGQDPERMKNILRGWETATEDFVKEKGIIDWTALKKSLHLTEMVALLAQVHLGDLMPGLGGIFSGKKVQTKSFDGELARLKESGSMPKKIGKNLIYKKPSKDLIGLMGLIGPSGQFSGKDAEGKNVLSYLGSNTIVWPNNKQSRSMTSFGQFLPRMVDELKSKGITLRVITPGETIFPAKNNVINLVFVPGGDLPKKEGKLDMDALNIFRELFNRGGSESAQWYAPDIVAAVLWMDALKNKETDSYKVENAISDAGANANISASLQEIKLEDIT